MSPFDLWACSLILASIIFLWHISSLIGLKKNEGQFQQSKEQDIVVQLVRCEKLVINYVAQLMYDSFLAFQERVPDTHDSSPKMTEAILDAGKEVIISVPYNIELKKKKALGVISSCESEQCSSMGRWCEVSFAVSLSILTTKPRKDPSCESWAVSLSHNQGSTPVLCYVCLLHEQ